MSLSLACFSQADDNVFIYRKGSVYSIMLAHTNLAFAKAIEEAFVKMPIPDKYNDHNLGKKVFYTQNKDLKIKDLKKHEGFIVNTNSDKDQMNDIDFLLQKQFVASRMLAKWFNRDKNSGVCNMDLIQKRGYDNVSNLDRRLAALSVRKEALLMDAGEELIGSTFILINDIRYLDKSSASGIAGGIVNATVNVYNATQGDYSFDSNDLGDMIKTLKGFNVKIDTYLYQLVWDELAEGLFYNSVYTEKTDEVKKTNFEKLRGDFSLVYIGKQESSGKTCSFLGISEDEPELMVLKACQRAFDENVANLQKNFEVFKIKSPLLSTDPIQCEIGLKEGVTPDSKFEVLEVVEDGNGHVSYRRKGVIKPAKGQIWDNRFMAVEEGAENAEIGFTTFTKVSGGGFYPGMLVREIK